MLLALQLVPMILARHHGYWSNDTAMQIYKSIPTENPLTTKFFLKFKKREIDDCWEWNGTITACGYGSLRYHHKGKSMIFLAHRVSFVIFKGRIKDGLVIDHLCNNRKCVNPFHLNETTIYENAVRAIRSPQSKRKRLRKLKNTIKKHNYSMFSLLFKGVCCHGHKIFDCNDLYRSKIGSVHWYICKECVKNKSNERYAEKDGKKASTYD